MALRERAKQRPAPNIVIFTIDNVSANRVGAQGYRKNPTTPNIDAMAKRAPIRFRHHGRHSSGKYVILIEGDVASVAEAYEEGLQHAGDALLDHMQLAVVHDALWSALDGDYASPDERAALMVETTTVATCVESLDFSLKLVDASIVDLQLASGIGGKGYFALQGEQHDLDYLHEELAIRIPDPQRVAIDLIPRPHLDMLTAFGHSHPFDR